MKKKVYFGLGALVLVAVLALNVTLVKDGQNFELSLSALGAVAKAGDEGTVTVPCIDIKTYGSGPQNDRVCLDTQNHFCCCWQDHLYIEQATGTCTISE